MFAYGITLVALLALGQVPQDQLAGRLAGRVVDPDRNIPVGNARVNVMARPGGPPSMFEATTDADGQFVFDALPPGAYRVQAAKAGYANQPIDAPPQIVEVLPGQTREGISISLFRGGVITGHVVDAAGEVQAEVQVTALRKFPNRPAGAAAGLMPSGPGVQTNDLGEYRLYGLAAGEYYVQAMPRSMMSPFNTSPTRATIAVPTLFPNAPSAESAQPIVVGAGDTVTDVDVHLTVAPVFQLSGVVVDESGAPVGGAMVTVMPDRNPMSGGGPSFVPPSMSRSKPDGTFYLANLSAGTYSVRATPTPGGPVNFDTGSGGIGAVATGAVSSGGFAVWTTNVNGTVTQLASDNAPVRVTVTDANVDGVIIVVRRQ